MSQKDMDQGCMQPNSGQYFICSFENKESYFYFKTENLSFDTKFCKRQQYIHKFFFLSLNIIFRSFFQIQSFGPDVSLGAWPPVRQTCVNE